MSSLPEVFCAVHDVLPFLIEQIYAVVFVAVLVDHLGAPFPSTPFLVTAGALARTGEASATAALALALIASLLAQSVWYETGRRGGRKVLKLLCRIALEPDACVRRTENTFTRHGVKALLIAPFVPGLGTVARPMAAMFGVRFPQFIYFGLAGAAIWAASFLALGYAFGHQLVALLVQGASYGGRLAAGAAVVGFGSLGYKLLRRRALLRSLRVARIHPEELRRRLDGGERITILDLRGPQEARLDPRKIPGALRIPPEELAIRHEEIPRQAEVVLYCS